MSFKLVKGKIEEARLHIKSLDTVESVSDYKSRYHAAVSSLGSIWDTLKAEGAGKPNFEVWKEEKWKIIDSDPLLSYVFKWRGSDYHTGKTNLVFGSQLPKVTILKVEPGEAPMVFGEEGLYRIKNPGTANEERLPVHDINHTIKISMLNPPKYHLNKEIVSGVPESYLFLALKFYQELVFEASKNFS